VTLMLAVPVQAGAVSGGSISPTKLTSSGQKFEVTYAGRTTKDQGASVVVEECIADDRKADFDPTVDCSSLSRQSFYGVPESGTVTYGGNPTANPTAPFVGTDPENGQWSLCGTEAGVSNHDRGFLRISETPSDLTTDFFVPITCAAGGAEAGGPAKESSSRSTGVVLAAAAAAFALALIVWSARKRQKSKSSSQLISPNQRHKGETTR